MCSKTTLHGDFDLDKHHGVLPQARSSSWRRWPLSSKLKLYSWPTNLVGVTCKGSHSDHWLYKTWAAYREVIMYVSLWKNDPTYYYSFQISLISISSFKSSSIEHEDPPCQPDMVNSASKKTRWQHQTQTQWVTSCWDYTGPTIKPGGWLVLKTSRPLGGL